MQLDISLDLNILTEGCNLPLKPMHSGLRSSALSRISVHLIMAIDPAKAKTRTPTVYFNVGQSLFKCLHHLTSHLVSSPDVNPFKKRSCVTKRFHIIKWLSWISNSLERYLRINIWSFLSSLQISIWYLVTQFHYLSDNWILNLQLMLKL